MKRRQAAHRHQLKLSQPRLDKILQLSKQTFRETKQDRLTMLAASLAFHWFLALFPAALVLIGVSDLVGLSPSSLHSLVHGIGTVMPAATAQVVDGALKAHSSKGAGGWEILIGAVVALWSATEAMAALQVGLDVAFEVDRDRGFFGRRLMGVPLLLLTIVLGGSASAVLVFGDPLRALLPHHSALAATGADFAWDVLRWAGAAVLGSTLLSTYYAIGPRRDHLRWRFVTWGSTIAMLGWLVASLAFSFYVDHLGHAVRSYGAFADVAVLLLWLYVTGLMVLVGGEINSEIERARESGPPVAGETAAA
ncbi:MAG: YihY/virulence factor BrkB family protein [Acidimicrobiales bacterium]